MVLGTLCVSVGSATDPGKREHLQAAALTSAEWQQPSAAGHATRVRTCMLLRPHHWMKV